eukprot:366326-Chlamydomonas_euryale.AAC.4
MHQTAATHAPSPPPPALLSHGKGLLGGLLTDETGAAGASHAHVKGFSKRHSQRRPLWVLPAPACLDLPRAELTGAC